MRKIEVLDELPGCGFAAYAGLLVVLGGLGGLVSFGSCLVVLHGGPQRGPSPLMPGSQVPVRQLDPLRAAGLLDLGEAPLAFHDESASLDGSEACALRQTEIVALRDGVAARIPYAAIEQVELQVGDDTQGVRVTGAGATLVCTFRADEGVERFHRQVEAERDHARAEGPVSKPAAEGARDATPPAR